MYQQNKIINAPNVVIQLVLVMILLHLLRTVIAPSIPPLEKLVWKMSDYLIFVPVRLTYPTFFTAAPFGALLPLPAHALLHADWTHLLLNAAFFLAFGSFVARLLSPTVFLFLYFLSAVSGALLHTLLAPDSIIPLIGASGAISGILGFTVRLAMLPHRQRLFPPALGNKKTFLVLGAIFFAVNLAIIFWPLFTGNNSLIAGDAHIGGFIFGFLWAPFLSIVKPEPHS